MTKNERFGHAFAKTGSINSGTDHISENLVTIKIPTFSVADPDLGSGAVLNRDPRWKKFGSVIQDKNPGSATLLFPAKCFISAFVDRMRMQKTMQNHAAVFRTGPVMREGIDKVWKRHNVFSTTSCCVSSQSSLQNICLFNFDSEYS
jgi:hypothetical protein